MINKDKLIEIIIEDKLNIDRVKAEILDVKAAVLTRDSRLTYILYL